VDEIDDRLHGDFGSNQGSAGNAGVTRLPAPLRIVDVCEGARPTIKGRMSRGRVGVTVPASHDDPLFHKMIDEPEGARQLGGQRHVGHRPSITEVSGQLEVGLTGVKGIVSPRPIGVDKRTLEVDSENTRPPRTWLERASHLQSIFVGAEG
jgi:hypothetical protein